MKDLLSVITLTLLHPLQSVPVQSWTFEPESVIRIGRSTDNEVILYSAVVSRHHVELRRNGSSWVIVSLGANGTYIDGKRITQVPVEDGMIIRLASSGPKIQIHLDEETAKAKLKAALGKRSSSKTKGIDVSRETLVNSKATQSEEEH
ncbi:MAG TPA: FHA domain-containing protein [Coleofasciculaceae cyanobacterium]